jgi:hypothetical protein
MQCIALGLHNGETVVGLAYAVACGRWMTAFTRTMHRIADPDPLQVYACVGCV